MVSTGAIIPEERLDSNDSINLSSAHLRPWAGLPRDAKKPSTQPFSIGGGGIRQGGLYTRGFAKKSQPDRPLITVITVVLNGVCFLENCINSVLSQTYENIEFIVLDGGSTDGTVDIIKKYDDRIDYWVSGKDGGIYEAMTRGTEIANGDWIYFLGCDDILIESIAAMAVFLRDKMAIYYGDVFLPHQNKKYDGVFTARKLLLNNISHQSMFFPRSLFCKYSFDLKYRTHADHELNMRLFCHSPYSFVYAPVLVAVFNDCNGVSSLAEDPVLLANRHRLIKAYFPRHLYVYFLIRCSSVRCMEILGLKKTFKLLLKRRAKSRVVPYPSSEGD